MLGQYISRIAISLYEHTLINHVITWELLLKFTFTLHQELSQAVKKKKIIK